MREENNYGDLAWGGGKRAELQEKMGSDELGRLVSMREMRASFMAKGGGGEKKKGERERMAYTATPTPTLDLSLSLSECCHA